MGIQLHLVGAKTRIALAASAPARLALAGKPLQAINWAGFSGRGVRLRAIGADEKEAAEKAAATAVGPDGLLSTYQKLRARECIERCLVEVTKEREVVELGAATWTTVTAEDLAGMSKRPGLTLDALFTSKDLDVLRAWFADNHDASQADLEAITGGAIETADNEG